MNKTIIQNKQKTAHFLGIQNFEVVCISKYTLRSYTSLAFFLQDAYLAGSYIVILIDAKSFSPDTVLQLLYTSVKSSC